MSLQNYELIIIIRSIRHYDDKNFLGFFISFKKFYNQIKHFFVSIIDRLIA